MLFRSDTTRILVSALQQQFRDAGISMEVRTNEFATFFSDVQKGNFQMYSLRWVGGNNDPDIFNLIFNSSMVPPNGANRGFYVNPEVDHLIQSARESSSIDERRKAYQQIQEIVAAELPYVSLWYTDNVCVYNKRVSGIHMSPAGNYKFLTDIRVSESTN